jgi:exodeoxyribonuclease VII large subunit
MSQFTLNLAPERKIWTVSELTARIRDLLGREFQDILLEGEISNFKAAPSRHLYFTLKDERAQIRCVCFANQARLLRFRPEDGQHVIARGSITVYEPRGEYQLSVTSLEPVGLGALQLAFEQLKQKLEKEGLFDPARKKPLPMLPRRIGLVTSPSGAAVRDILRILRRRFPNLHLLLFPVRVQGEGAAEEIAAGLRYFSRATGDAAVDVVILARGGGSLEDLWAFNEEVVARAIADCTVPVISGVGHETDFTIADFVADVRASTPSNAAELVVRTRAEFEAHIAQLEQRLVQRARYFLLELRHRLQELAGHPNFRRVEDLLRQHQQRLDELTGRMTEQLEARLAELKHRAAVAQARLAAFDLRSRLETLRTRLEQRMSAAAQRIERLLQARREALGRLVVQLDERSPLRLLERGYSIAYDASGRVLRSAEQVAEGDAIAVLLHRGRLWAEVTRRETKREKD